MKAGDPGTPHRWCLLVSGWALLCVAGRANALTADASPGLAVSAVLGCSSVISFTGAGSTEQLPPALFDGLISRA